MLAYDEILQNLLTFNTAEITYYSLYKRYPHAFDRPILGWSEFCERVSSSAPDEPPSILSSFLTEQDFFPNSSSEVNCFKNARYCPAFLHKLEFIKIVYVLKGSAFFFFNHQRYEIVKGQFCIVSPGMEQAIFSCQDEDVVINVLLRASTFTNAFSALLVEHNILSDYFWKMSYTKYSKQVLMFTCSNNETLEKTIMKLYYEANIEISPSNLIMKSYVMIFLAEALREHQKSLITLNEANNEIYQLPAILQDIKENLNSITLRDLAYQWNMSEYDMNHYLKVEIGYSFSYLLLDLRICQAANLLLKTNDSIEKIMEKSGFSDTTFFYRTFKKKYGLTPQNYREYAGIKDLMLS